MPVEPERLTKSCASAAEHEYRAIKFIWRNHYAGVGSVEDEPSVWGPADDAKRRLVCR